MFKMNIKPRRATMESGAVIEHKKTKQRGFIIENTIGTFDILLCTDNGGMIISDTNYKQDDIGAFFVTYRVIAQRDEYTAFLKE